MGLGGYVFIRKDAIIDNVKSKIMESVLPGGLGDLGGGALNGVGGLIPDMGGMGAPEPDAPTRQAEPTAPVLPLGF